MTEAKRAVRQAKLCDCDWHGPSDYDTARPDETPNPWHVKLSSCPSAPELLFWRLMASAGLPLPEREYRFHPIRRWRMDYAWPAQKVAVEIQGGTWQGGRHSRGPGYEADCEKQNTALAMGWQLLRYTPGMLKTADVAAQVRGLLEP